MANQYKNHIVYFGDTLIDLRSDTVTAETLLEGYTAHKADGSVITGTYVPTSSAITVITTQDPAGGEVKEIVAVDISRDTVTAATLLSGYTAHDRSGNAITGTYVPSGGTIQANKNVTPTESAQEVTPDSGYDGLAKVTVAAISSNYIGSGVTRCDADDITIANNVITIPAGYYETAVTKDVPPGMKWMGSLPTQVIKLSDTDFATWTPSTTAKTIRAAQADVGTFVAEDLANYDWFVRTRIYINFVSSDGVTNVKGTPFRLAGENWNAVTRRSGGYANTLSKIRNNNVVENITTTFLYSYYNTATTQAYTSSYGIYPGNATPSLSSTSAASPTVTLKSPTLTARCNATYFATARASALDQENTKIIFAYDYYRAENGYMRKFVQTALLDTFNDGLPVSEE